MAKMCTVSRLERQFATLHLFHAPTQPGRPPESEPKRPEKEPEWVLGASTEDPP